MKNPTVVLNSLIAIGFVILGFIINWLFIIPAVILMIINQKLLLSNKKFRKN